MEEFSFGRSRNILLFAPMTLFLILSFKASEAGFMDQYSNLVFGGTLGVSLLILIFLIQKSRDSKVKTAILILICAPAILISILGLLPSGDFVSMRGFLIIIQAVSLGIPVGVALHKWLKKPIV